MRVAIVTALHERYALTELFLSYYAKTWGHPLYAVIDDDDLKMWNLVRHYPEWKFCEYKNEPLADKWLAAMQLCKENRADFDAVMIMGSDDFIDSVYRDHIGTALWLAFRENSDRFEDNNLPELHIQPRHVHYYDVKTGKMMRVKHKRPGAGRVLSNALLDKMKWKPWAAGDKNIDGSMDKRLASVYGGGNVPYMFVEDSIGVILDVKSKTSIWSYDHLRKGEFEDLNAAEFLPEHFPLIASPLLAKDVL